MFLFLLLLCYGFDLAYSRTEQNVIINAPIVTTPLGQIQGSKMTTRLGKPIFAFRGIRYAKAPINELRFKPPVPAEKWENVYNASEDGPVCPQPTRDPVSEDCLLLNVYSTKLPKINENPKRPVIVYLHPGGFYQVTGRSNWVGPKYLLDRDIVFVSINYRLGSLGFLSTGDKEALGNNGLKDQVQALKWIKQNIESFGGNPDSVTIMGYSAGATSVTLHLVSPMSEGLFHKAIAMSGSSLGNWPIQTNQLDIAKKQAQILGCPDDTSVNIVNCLRSKPATELGNSLTKFGEFGFEPVLIWGPVIENDFGQERFLTKHPISLIQEGRFQKVPFMSGITKDEFAGRAFNLINNPDLLQQMNKNWEKNAPIVFLYERNTNNSKVISKDLKTFYFNGKIIDNSTLPNLIQLYADSIIGFSVNRAVKLISEKNPHSVFYYRFNYKGRYSHFYLPGSNGTIPYGVVHHDDLIYLISSNIFPLFKPSDPEGPIVDKMTLMWTNFATNGKPIFEPSDKLDNVKWEAYDIKTQKYLDIGNKLLIGEKLYEERYQEWEKLFPLVQYEKIKAVSG